MARMVTDLRIGESLVLDGGIVVTLMQKSGQLAKLCIESDEPLQVKRQQERRIIPREESPGRRLADQK